MEKETAENIQEVLSAVRNDLLDLQRNSIDEDDTELLKSDILRLNDIIDYFSYVISLIREE